MLALAAEAARGANVRFVQSDLFDWTPDRAYDAVFFGFWLSHVPAERFVCFWATVAACLNPGGRVAFVDDAHRSDEELVYGVDSSMIQRTLADGSTHRVVKLAHMPAGLQQRLAELGWRFEIKEAAPFFWGVGRRRPEPVVTGS